VRKNIKLNKNKAKVSKQLFANYFFKFKYCSNKIKSLFFFKCNISFLQKKDLNDKKNILDLNGEFF